MSLAFNKLMRYLRVLILAIISIGFSQASFATDFQMPPSVADGGAEGGKSKKALVSKGTFRLLEDVQKSIDRGSIDEAFEKLNKLIIRVQENHYETAVVLKTAAYLYVTRDDSEKAIELMQLTLKMDVLAHANQQKLRYDLAQLLLSEKNYQASISQLQDWLKNAKEDEISPAIYIRLGNAYLQAKQHAEASKNFEAALKHSEKPVEYHHQLLLASYVVQEQYKKAIPLLKKMLILFPDKKKYPLQLVGLYDQTKQSGKALEAMELIYQRGLFDQTEEYSSLAYRLLDAGYPLKAARILQQGIKGFIVWQTPENLNLLAQSYINSQQIDLAIPILEKAVLTSEIPDTALILSQLYIEKEDYKSAIQTLENLLTKSPDSKLKSIKFQLANIYFRNQELNKAREIYQALSSDSTLSKQQRKQVDQWTKFLDRRLGRA